MVRFIGLKGACFYPIFAPRARPLVMEKPALVAVTIYLSTICSILHSVNQRTPDVFPVVFLRIIKRIVQSAAFLTTQGRIDD